MRTSITAFTIQGPKTSPRRKEHASSSNMFHAAFTHRNHADVQPDFAGHIPGYRCPRTPLSQAKFLASLLPTLPLPPSTGIVAVGSPLVAGTSLHHDQPGPAAEASSSGSPVAGLPFPGPGSFVSFARGRGLLQSLLSPLCRLLALAAAGDAKKVDVLGPDDSKPPVLGLAPIAAAVVGGFDRRLLPPAADERRPPTPPGCTVAGAAGAADADGDDRMRRRDGGLEDAAAILFRGAGD